MTPLAGKWVKSPKKSAIFDHILLKVNDAIFENLTILLKENKFKLHLKEALLIKLDKPWQKKLKLFLRVFWLIAFIICIYYLQI